MLAAIMPGQALALDPDRSLDQLRHTRWTLRDGAPGNIRALAQGRDGFLWLGSSTGLYRFDGVRFERILPDKENPRRSLQVTALLAARNGDIWVGYDFGGIGIYRNGRLTDANPWTPQGGVGAIVEARDGAIWVAAEARGKMLLSRHERGRWTRYGQEQGLVDGLMGPLLAASDGSIYVALPPTLLRLAPGAGRFDRLNGKVSPFAALAQDARGLVWLADDSGLRPIGRGAARITLDQISTPYVTRHLSSDRDGALWITGQNGGLARLRTKDGQASHAIEQVSARHGLSATLTLSMLEDREGNVWIGTEAGLDRYSPANVVRATSGEALVTGFVAPPNSDNIFFAGLAGVYRASRNAPSPTLIFRKSDIGVLCGDARRLLAISLDGAFLLDLDKSDDVSRTTPVAGPLSVSCALDKQGVFWTGMDRVYRLVGSKLVQAAGPAGQPRGTVTMLRADDGGGLLAAQSRRGLIQIDNGAEKLLLSNAALAIGALTTIASDGQRRIVGGQKGIALLGNHKVTALTERTYPYLAGITGIHRASDGWTWLIGATGIVRIENKVLDEAFANPGTPMPYQRVGHEADYRARSNLFDANDIAQDPSGRLWFATNSGLAWIDPHRLARNERAPPVVIRSLRVDGATYENSGRTIQLPAHTGRVQIDYTALSLSDAPANRFRYRLSGAGGEWFDAGVERQALFTNLGPGKYEFRVIAANNDGVWNQRGASLTFEIAPAFYQTRWFLLLGLAIFGGGIWLLYRRRLRIVADRARSRVETQLAERERIARELHDTLLQGFQGLMLRFQAVVELLPRGDRARVELESSLDRAEDVLIESRERVHALREELEPVALAGHLSVMLQEMVPDSLAWGVEEEGAARLICAPVADEISRIVREAISNAIRHADARNIVILIRHASDKFTLSVIDDGIGLPSVVRETGKREGHYGMVGMRERAQRLTGTLDILAGPKGGTEIRMTIPARIAYQ